MSRICSWWRDFDTAAGLGADCADGASSGGSGLLLRDIMGHHLPHLISSDPITRYHKISQDITRYHKMFWSFAPISPVPSLSRHAFRPRCRSPTSWRRSSCSSWRSQPVGCHQVGRPSACEVLPHGLRLCPPVDGKFEQTGRHSGMDVM